jgi:uncharacterized protein DUF1376
MVTFYKRYIAEHMDKTESLSDGAYRVHDVIEELIMLNEGPITDNERGIAGRCNMRPDRYRAYRDELAKAGKIRIVDGKILIDRCIDALTKIEDNRKNAGEGGKQSGKTRRKLSMTCDGLDEVSNTSRDGLDEVSNTSRDGLDEVSNTSRDGLDEVSNTSRDGLDEVSNAKPLKTNDAREAALQQDRSLKDSLRLTKTKDSCRVPGGTPTVKNDPFDRFWAVYPKRKGDNSKKDARKLFGAALGRGTDPEEIIAGAKRYAADMADDHKIGTVYVKQAETWLRKECWDRDDAPASNVIPIKRFWADEDSPQWKAWDAEARKKGRRAAVTQEKPDGPDGRYRRGWFFDQEWPPGHEQAAPIAA